MVLDLLLRFINVHKVYSTMIKLNKPIMVRGILSADSRMNSVKKFVRSTNLLESIMWDKYFFRFYVL